MRHEIISTRPETVAGIATAEAGIVFLDGPNGIAATLTADCAEGTGKSLIAAAQRARTQHPAS